MSIGHQGYIEKLMSQIESMGNALCVGCDPDLTESPAFAQGWFERYGPVSFLENFSYAMIETAAGKVPAIKFQSAFYEAWGPEGFRVLQSAIRLAKANRLVTILDAKRGDISSTMRAYGEMAFGQMNADALTVTPYMGTDTVDPLESWLVRGYGVYLVWVSSNPAGATLQDCRVNNNGELLSSHIYREFAQFFDKRKISDSLGLVLGATRVESIEPNVRAQIKNNALLMPGVGAQGGIVTDEIRNLIRSKRTLIPQSRQLSRGSDNLRDWNGMRDHLERNISIAASDLKVPN